METTKKETGVRALRVWTIMVLVSLVCLSAPQFGTWGYMLGLAWMWVAAAHIDDYTELLDEIRASSPEVMRLASSRLWLLCGSFVIQAFFFGILASQGEDYPIEWLLGWSIPIAAYTIIVAADLLVESDRKERDAFVNGLIDDSKKRTDV